MWARQRPTMVRQCGFRNLYMFGAINPKTGQRVCFVVQECNHEVMNIFLDLLHKVIGPDEVVILILDQAGWHSSCKNLVVPNNIYLLDLPPYSPELNPMENVWNWLKDNFLKNRFISKDEDLLKLGCNIWNKLTDEISKSICSRNYLSFLY